MSQEPIFAFIMPGMGELIVILIIILVLFGAARIPEIARSFGKGIKEFKSSINEDDKPDSDKKP
ncbi:MAG: sec-independent protein translocase protein TatA [Candidatus Omnitrophota bacterium]|jgi:sec-independent protein translocase protein TatA